MIFRVTFGFEGQGVGWSENHALKSNNSNPRSQVILTQNVAQKRVTFLGREFAINATRISCYFDDIAGVRAKGTWVDKTRFVNPVTTDNQSAEPAAVAIISINQTTAQLATPALAANISRTYLGAPPDVSVIDGGAVVPGRGNLGVNYAQWTSLMLSNGFGWLADARLADMRIDEISATPQGTVRITTVDAFPMGVAIGTTYPARARGINNRRSPINGPLVVTATAAKTFETQEVIGLALAQAGGFIRIYQPIQPFCGYSNMNMDLEVAKHQRGRPFGSSPGRAPNRVRG